MDCQTHWQWRPRMLDQLRRDRHIQPLSGLGCAGVGSQGEAEISAVPAPPRASRQGAEWPEDNCMIQRAGYLRGCMLVVNGWPANTNTRSPRAARSYAEAQLSCRQVAGSSTSIPRNGRIIASGLG